MHPTAELVEQLFFDALDHGPLERDRLLGEAGSQQPEVAQRVRALLAAQTRLGRYL